MDRKTHKLVYGYEGKIYANMILVLALALLAHGLFGLAEEEIARAQDRYSTSEGGTILEQTIIELTSTTINTTTINTTNFKATGKAVINIDNPPFYFDQETAGDTDWWLGVPSDVDGVSNDSFAAGLASDQTGFGSNTKITVDPNGVLWTDTSSAPDLVVEGARQWDSDDNALESTDGTNDFLLSTAYKMFSTTISNPDGVYAVDPCNVLYPIRAEKFPGGFTVQSVGISTRASSTYSVTFFDANAPNDPTPDIIAVAATSGSLVDVNNVITSAAIDPNDFVLFQLPATDANSLTIWFGGLINDND